MHGEVIGPVSDEERDTFGRVHDAYDMTMHARGGSAQAAVLNTAFANEFGIFGPPSYCVERIAELIELGIDRFLIVGPTPGARDPEQARAAERLVSEVLPKLR